MKSNDLKMGCSLRSVITTRRKKEIKFTGRLIAANKKEGKIINEFLNSITTVGKNTTARGAATGSFNAINSVRLNFNEGNPKVVTVSSYSGGNGTVDYISFIFSWHNDTGSDVVISSLDLGYNLTAGGAGDVYFQATNYNLEVPNGIEIEWRWVITVGYESGDVTATYRYRIAKMLGSGSFNVPAYVNFQDDQGGDHKISATLSAGGDGTVNYHTWTATYTAPAGGMTIDIIHLGPNQELPWTISYTTSDIADVTLTEGQELTEYITITHN